MQERDVGGARLRGRRAVPARLVGGPRREHLRGALGRGAGRLLRGELAQRREPIAAAAEAQEVVVERLGRDPAVAQPAHLVGNRDLRRVGDRREQMSACLQSANGTNDLRRQTTLQILKSIPEYYLSLYPPIGDVVAIPYTQAGNDLRTIAAPWLYLFLVGYLQWFVFPTSVARWVERE